MADMLAGLISKLLKSLHNSLCYHSLNEQTSKKTLDKYWFQISKSQLNLYKKMYHLILELNNDWYKLFSGIYADDLILFISLLEFMDNFKSVNEINKNNINMQGEYFNAYACDCLSKYFKNMKNKLLIELIQNNSKKYFLNQKGEKIFFNTNNQPILKITNNEFTYNVLAVRFNKENVPLITILENNQVKCYRLPMELSEWTMELIQFANMGINIFPANVSFSKIGDRYLANIL